MTAAERCLYSYEDEEVLAEEIRNDMAEYLGFRPQVMPRSFTLISGEPDQTERRRLRQREYAEERLHLASEERERRRTQLWKEREERRTLDEVKRTAWGQLLHRGVPMKSRAEFNALLAEKTELSQKLLALYECRRECFPEERALVDSWIYPTRARMRRLVQWVLSRPEPLTGNNAFVLGRSCHFDEDLARYQNVIGMVFVEGRVWRTAAEAELFRVEKIGPETELTDHTQASDYAVYAIELPSAWEACVSQPDGWGVVRLEVDGLMLGKVDMTTGSIAGPRPPTDEEIQAANHRLESLRIQENWAMRRPGPLWGLR